MGWITKGIYVIGFFPVVPKDKARIRVQLSAHKTLDKAISAFIEVGKC
jgi:glycine C-acetyltransferase